jgi:hypothetical protein
MFTGHLLTNGTIAETTIRAVGPKPSKPVFCGMVLMQQPEC